MKLYNNVYDTLIVGPTQTKSKKQMTNYFGEYLGMFFLILFYLSSTNAII